MEYNRLIIFNGTVDFCNIGGYENNEGRHVKWRKTYRSDSLSGLTERDEGKSEKMNAIVDCDLRTSNGQVMVPDRKWPGVEMLDYHVYAEDSSGNFVNDSYKLYRSLYYVPKVDSYLGGICQNVILSPAGQKAFARVFAALLTPSENEALVYHCSTGEDRAGMTTALILKGLGIDGHIVTRDYLLTNELYIFGLERQLPSDLETIKVVNQMNVTEGEGTVVKGITQTIDVGYGGFENYSMKGLGFSKQDLKGFRKLYLE